MANFKTGFFAVSLLVATSSAAPRNEKFEIKIPEGCEKSGFCSIRPEGYDKIEKMIDSLLSPHVIANVENRFGPPLKFHVPETDPDNCPSRIVTENPHIHIYKEDDTNTTKVDLIVQNKLFPQMVEQVICDPSKIAPKNRQSDNKQCFSKLNKGEFLNFSCQKSMATRTLLVFDPEYKRIVPKGYPISVCCSCQVRNGGGV